MRYPLLLTCVLAIGCVELHAGENWPAFRGPAGQGHSDSKGLPTRWSETTNIAWKTRIHDLGWSTPVVWGSQVWMTTATADGKEMFAVCVDRETGSIVHDIHLFHNESPEPLGNAVNAYASPSPVIEEGRVYVHFGSYGTACLDSTTGQVIWQRRDLPCNHYRGPGSSVILFRDFLIVTMDGTDVQYVTALNKQTGATVWKSDRPTDFKDLDPSGKPISDGDLRKAYTTPLIVEVEGSPLMISSGAKAAYAYDPRTGQELWHVTYNGFSNAASPLYGHGMFYLNTGYGRAELWAVKPGGQGDVTLSHVAWKYSKGVPLKPTPLLIDGLIYMVDDSGVATCIEAETGMEVWKSRIGGKYSATPVFADGKIYVPSEEGKVTVIKPGRSLEILAENALEDGFMSSPAIAGRSLFLRTRTHLYRVEDKQTSN